MGRSGASSHAFHAPLQIRATFGCSTNPSSTTMNYWNAFRDIIPSSSAHWGVGEWEASSFWLSKGYLQILAQTGSEAWRSLARRMSKFSKSDVFAPKIIDCLLANICIHHRNGNFLSVDLLNLIMRAELERSAYFSTRVSTALDTWLHSRVGNQKSSYLLSAGSPLSLPSSLSSRALYPPFPSWKSHISQDTGTWY